MLIEQTNDFTGLYTVINRRTEGKGREQAQGKRLKSPKLNKNKGKTEREWDPLEALFPRGLVGLLSVTLSICENRGIKRDSTHSPPHTHTCHKLLPSVLSAAAACFLPLGLLIFPLYFPIHSIFLCIYTDFSLKSFR